MRVDNNYDKWNINKLPRNKNQQGAGGNGVVYLGSNSDREGNGFPELEGHYLWGQYFNGKQDVNGDLTTDGDINFYGNLNFMGEYDPNDDLHGNLNIGKVNAEDGHFTNLNADNFNALEAYIDNLTVTGSAHFFELIIDKIRSVGGAIMLTPGDGFELWGYNLNTGNQFNLWWVKTDDRNGKYNNWVVGDQALCRSFDSAQVGTSSNVDNKYWWAKVVAVDSTGKWCTKLHANDYNPDEVMKLPEGNDNAYYTNTHSYLKKTDFTRTDNYVYVETAHKNHWLTNEEYFYLDDNEKAEHYEYSQLYAHTKEDGTVLQITELQYNNNDPDEVDLLIYDDVEDDWRLLRQFCKADCKFCFNITIDISQYASGSTFRVQEGSPSHYAYVFQEGDNIIMLGNQNNTNRQNAIYLCAGGEGDSLDSNLKPPFFAQYKGINNFNLESHRLTWFSGGWRAGAQGTQGYDNEIRGNLRVSTGETVEDYVGSQLVVEEDRIAMKVKSDISEAGITILDNQIILDAAKTEVTGELTLTDNDSGFVLYDSDHNPAIAIQNTPVGDSSTASYTIYGDDVLNGNRTTNTIHLYIKSSTIRVIQGQYSIDNMKLLTNVNDANPNTWDITNVVASGYIRKTSDNSNVATLFSNSTISGTAGSKYVDLGGPFTFTSSYEGNCYVYLDVVINFSTTITGSAFGGQTTTKITSVTNKIMKIGSDGVIFITSPNQYAMFNSAKYELKHGTNVLTVDDNTIRRSIGLSKVDIGAISPVVLVDIGESTFPSLINYYGANDSFYGIVVYTGTESANVSHNLPNPSSDNMGAKYIFKNRSNRAIYLHTMHQDTIIHPGDNTPIQTGTTGGYYNDQVYQLDVGEIIIMVSDGTYWNVLGGAA